jgi:phenylpyruvate tautomerase PptA (4-oxalocrotonate tautomerase family)
MPVIECHLIEGYSEAARRRLSEALTDAVRIVVPAAPEAVTVMIHQMAPSDYMRGRRARTPAPALPDPADLVRGFLAAMEARDLAQAEGYLAPDFEMIFPGGVRMTRLQELVDWAAPRYRFVTKSYQGVEALQSPGAETIVYCRGTLSGEWPNGTPFSDIRFIDRFEIIQGRLTRQEVWNDIAESKGQT